MSFQREITAIIKENNTLTVHVDSRFVSIPPAGNPKGPHSVDYLLPGGITGSVHLRVLPQVFVALPLNRGISEQWWISGI